MPVLEISTRVPVLESESEVEHLLILLVLCRSGIVEFFVLTGTQKW